MLRPALLLLCVLLGSGCVAPVREDVFVKGSDTMHALVEAWRAGFEAEHADCRVVLAGGGSSAGMYALLNGLADLAASSRPMNAKERRVARRKELDVFELEVARDGIAVIVHPDNPVRALSMDQLAAVFTGTSTSWAAVGGPDLPVTVLIRDPRSGTRAFFADHVLGGRPAALGAQEVASTDGVVDAVARAPARVGYVGMGATMEDRVATVGLRPAPNAEPVLPSPAAVTDQRYPLARSLYLYAVVRPTGAVARFVDHALGPAGQKAVADAGFVAVR